MIMMTKMMMVPPFNSTRHEENLLLLFAFDVFDLHPTMAANYEFYLEFSIRGYHAYFKNLMETITVGDILECEIDSNNPHDQYAIVVRTFRDETVGHVPIELSEIFWKFLSNYGEIEAECIGHRYNAGGGKGLELPVDSKFFGNRQQ